MARVCAYVLVADDDPKNAELVKRYLDRDGHETKVVHDGRAAIDEVRSRKPDLLVLDVMMPKVDGLDVCRVLRKESDVPVLMLTARSTADDLLLGFDLGADDYLTKPYDPRELMARIKAILQRTKKDDQKQIQVGALKIDQMRHEVTVDGRRIECTPVEFKILITLAANPDRVFTRGQLLEQARGIDGFITERTVDVHISNLRKKVEEQPRKPKYLVTVYGVGYKVTNGAQD